jgi:citrate lyase subunit beta/citryl-CoA lyase
LEDCSSIVPAAPTGIVVPKVNGVEDIIRIGSILEALEKEHDIHIGATKIIALTAETPESIFSLGGFHEEIPRLQALTWGAEDLATSLGSSSNLTESKTWTEPFQIVRSLCLIASHAAKVEAIDTVMADFNDLEQLANICQLAKRDGFTGKMCIHPSQVAIVNECFSPTKSEIVEAETVVSAFAANPESGALQIDGKLIDKPHLEKARRVLQLAKVLEQPQNT